jgi:hypothetical protein
MDRIHIDLDLDPASGVLQKFFRQKMQRAALGSPEKHLPAVTSPEPDKGGFGGADNVHLSAGGGRGQFPRPFPDLIDGLFPFCLFRAGEVHADQAGEGRISKLPAEGNFIRVETFIVVFLRPADGVMVGVESLDDDASRLISPPAPARHLCQDLEGSLCRPEVRDVQGGVGGKDADQCDLREIVSLGDHLGADKDVNLSPVESPEDLLRVPLPRG